MIASAPQPVLTVHLLADHPEYVPALAAHFREEWPSALPAAEYLARFQACAQRDALPLALIAIGQDELLGTIGLRWDSVRLRPHLGPWVAAFYVVPQHRNCGVGSLLLAEVEHTAAGLRLAELYAGTAGAASLFRRQGWAPIEMLAYDGEHLTIFHKSLRRAG